MIRAGIAGVGFMGWMHWLAYQRTEAASVAAICSRDEKETRRRLAGHSGQLRPPRRTGGCGRRQQLRVV